jgi:hypothetical protein
MSLEYDAAALVKGWLEACQAVIDAGLTVFIDTEDDGAYTTAHAVVSPLATSMQRISSDQFQGQAQVVVDVFIPPAAESKELATSSAFDLLDAIRTHIVKTSDVRLANIETSRPMRLDGSVDMDGWSTFGFVFTILAGKAIED